MPMRTEQNQNAKEAPHNNTGKRKKPEEHGQERAAKMPTRQRKRCKKNFVTNAYVVHTCNCN